MGIMLVFAAQNKSLFDTLKASDNISYDGLCKNILAVRMLHVSWMFNVSRPSCALWTSKNSEVPCWLSSKHL